MGNCNSNNRKVYNEYFLDNPLNMYCDKCNIKIEYTCKYIVKDCCNKYYHIDCLEIYNNHYVCPVCKKNNHI